MNHAAMDANSPWMKAEYNGTVPLSRAALLSWLCADHGTLLGHAIPGAAFVISGIRAYAIFIYQQIVLRDQPYRPRALQEWYDIAACMCVSVAGILGE